MEIPCVLWLFGALLMVGWGNEDLMAALEPEAEALKERQGLGTLCVIWRRCCVVRRRARSCRSSEHPIPFDTDVLSHAPRR